MNNDNNNNNNNARINIGLHLSHKLAYNDNVASCYITLQKQIFIKKRMSLYFP